MRSKWALGLLLMILTLAGCGGISVGPNQAGLNPSPSPSPTSSPTPDPGPVPAVAHVALVVLENHSSS
ncbi:MAG TPA: hypothetical protein VKL40_02025, partial [Candidatus Angelobacter sp.]|nr:hypothetical protein [Candidatus Angelobacter sp.]